MTTVTIADGLRKRLKRLAAKYDTTQSDIIERAVDLFERNLAGMTSENVNTIPNAACGSRDANLSDFELKLAKAKESFELEHPRVARVHATIRENLMMLEEARISGWELHFEE